MGKQLSKMAYFPYGGPGYGAHFARPGFHPSAHPMHAPFHHPAGPFHPTDEFAELRAENAELRAQVKFLQNQSENRFKKIVDMSTGDAISDARFKKIVDMTADLHAEEERSNLRFNKIVNMTTNDV